MHISKPNKQICERNVKSFGYEACGKEAVARVESDDFNGNVCAHCLDGLRRFAARSRDRVKDVRR